MVEPHRICHKCYNGNVRLPVRSIDQISVLGLAQNTCRPSPHTRKCRWLEWFSQRWSWSLLARALCSPSSVTSPDIIFSFDFLQMRHAETRSCVFRFL